MRSVNAQYEPKRGTARLPSVILNSRNPDATVLEANSYIWKELTLGRYLA
jgi:hypothetical protein